MSAAEDLEQCVLKGKRCFGMVPPRGQSNREIDGSACFSEGEKGGVSEIVPGTVICKGQSLARSTLGCGKQGSQLSGPLPGLPSKETCFLNCLDYNEQALPVLYGPQRLRRFQDRLQNRGGRSPGRR